MKIVTYNIQYGIGLDGQYDIGRIADAVRGADVIALQEVTRNNPNNQGRDMVAEIEEALPNYFSAYGAPYEVDMGSAIEKGRVVNRRFQFGNMVLSRTPILASRNLLLPRMRTYDILNLQRGALEALIATPFGPIRFHSVHLDHTSPAERILQVRWLIAKALAYANEGGAVTGVSEFGFPEPPHPEEFVLMGDFNLTPGSPEYAEIVGIADVEFGLTRRSCLPMDTATLGKERPAERITWVDTKERHGPKQDRCLDYVFVHAALAPRVTSTRIDTEAVGSDHRPVWVELA
jgi:endonuclease/exonuclease/phosphatase family metal-dependent hydrolase